MKISRRVYERSWSRRQAAAEGRHRSKIKAALNEQLGLFVSYADANGLAVAMSLIDNIITPDVLYPVIQNLYVKEGTRAGIAEQVILNQAYGDEYPEPATKAFNFFTDWLTEMTSFFYRFGMEAITRMTRTTKDQVRKSVSDGLAKQESYPEIRDRLQRDIPEINRQRANVIARTETVSAMSHGKQTAAASLPFQMIKGWLSILDKRTRHTHREMNGEKRLLTEPYSNGGQYPGDPELPAKERIQCRCTEIYEPVRDANGRPVKK